MSRIGKQLKKIAIEQLNVEVAIDNQNNKPPEDSIDGIIDSVQENIENIQANAKIEQEQSSDDTQDSDDTQGSDEDTGLPNPDDDTSDSDNNSDNQEIDKTGSEEDSDKKETKEEPKSGESDKDDAVDEDSSQTTKAADKVEDESDKATVAQEAIGSLEDIAELLEQSIEIGGIDPKAAELLDITTNAITAPTGVAIEGIKPELFQSYSGRKRYSLESISEIKEKIKQIIAKIINAIKNVIKFIRDVFRAYKLELNIEKNKLDKIKSLYNEKLKVDPYEKTLSGAFAKNLLVNDKVSTKDIVGNVSDTYLILSTYVEVFKRDLDNALGSFEEFKKKTFDIDLENEENELTRFTKKDLAKYGQFFGKEYSKALAKVDNDKEVEKPNSTMVQYSSDMLAGCYKYVAFTANELNVKSEDILASKMFLFKSPASEELPDTVQTCTITSFKTLIEHCGNFIKLTTVIDNNISYVEKEFNKLLDYVNNINTKLVKSINKPLENAGVETNLIHAPTTLSHLVKTCINDFYIKSINDTLKYNLRITKSINTYLDLSIKQYL